MTEPVKDQQTEKKEEASESSSTSKDKLKEVASPAPRRNRTSSLLDVESQERKEIRDKATTLVNGRKRRRESSVGPTSKRFIGDHIGATDTEEIMSVLEENGDTNVNFADGISRLAQHSHMTENLFIVSDKNCYILSTRTLSLAEGTQPIPIDSIEKLSTSTERDNAIIVHLPEYRSELIMTPNKTELIGTLVHVYEEVTKSDLQVEFSNAVEFLVNSDTMFEVDFIPGREGVKMTVLCKGAQDTE